MQKFMTTGSAGLAVALALAVGTPASAQQSALDGLDREAAGHAASVQAGLEGLAEALSGKDAELDEMADAMIAAEAKIVGLEIDLATARSRAGEAADGLAAAEAQIAELEAELAAAAAEADGMADAAIASEARIVGLEIDLKTARDRGAAAEEALAAAEAEVAGLTEAAAAAAAKIDELEGQVLSDEAKIVGLEIDLKTARDLAAVNAEALAQSEEANGLAATNLAELTASNEETAATLDSLQDDMLSAEAKIVGLEVDLSTARGRAETAEARVAELEAMISEKEEALAAAEIAAAEPTLDARARRDLILIQQGLRDAGTLNGPVDGIWGPATERALRAFKEQSGLPDDDEYTAATEAALFPEGIPGR